MQQHNQHIDDMLFKLRQIITIDDVNTKQELNKQSKTDDIQRMIKKSLINIKKQPLKVSSEIPKISNLINNENTMIKNYIKDKVTSKVFHRHDVQQITPEHQEYIQNRKKIILNKKLQQQQLQQKREQDLIDKVHSYYRFEKDISVPIQQIDTQLYKQPQHILYQKELSHYKSQKNEISEQNISKYIQDKQVMIKESLKPEPDGSFQIYDQEYNQTQFIQQRDKNMQKYMQQALIKSKNFFKVFQQFLKQQIHLNELDEISKAQFMPHMLKSQSSQNFRKKETGHVYPQKNLKQFVQPNKFQSLFKITNQKTTKGMVLMPCIQQENTNNDIISIKIINKMIGNSDKFHIKKCQLFENHIWYGDQDSNSDDYKKITIPLQRIQICKQNKSEGSFFSSKIEQGIQVIVIHGKQRDFIFEKNYIQGQQLYAELCQLMSNKCYHVNAILNAKHNSELEQFINNSKYHIFSLSHGFLPPYNLYPVKSCINRELSIQIFIDIFNYRSHIKIVNLQACLLSFSQLMILIPSFVFFKQLKKIIMSHTFLNKEIIVSLYDVINQNNAKQCELFLSSCGIDDEIFISSILDLNKIYHKLIWIDLSKNKLTQKSVTCLSHCLSDSLCVIKHLDISDCPIMNFGSFSKLIKNAKKLQKILAQNCGFFLNNTKQIVQFFENIRQTTVKQIDLLRNEPINNIKILENCWNDSFPTLVTLQVTMQSKTISYVLDAQICNMVNNIYNK